MKERNRLPFPFQEIGTDIYLKIAWEKGLLNDYSDDNFLIKAIENRINNIEWETQLLSNNSFSIYSPLDTNYKIDYATFSQNFVLNLSRGLQQMSDVFGTEKIQKFIKDQLAAGKVNYNANSFFQALSEVEILKFYCNRYAWDSANYEPPLGLNGSNPEASFSLSPSKDRDFMQDGFTINIEVKTPGFPILDYSDNRRAIPTILLNNEGISCFSQLCEKNHIKCIFPRVTKLVEFLNSAAKKFRIPQENELNLLYINWSYSDFPSNSFLEAWSLLTNETNGILNHPEIGMNLPFREPVCEDVYNKISGVIVYTSSIDQLMFSDFRYSWQRTSDVGCRFRMIQNSNLFNEKIQDEQNRNLFLGTGMNPDLPIGHKWRILFERNWTATTLYDDKVKDCKFEVDAINILDHYYLNNQNR